jgi:hypothetical protein
MLLCGDSLPAYIHVAELPVADVRLVIDSPAHVLPEQKTVCVNRERLTSPFDHSRLLVLHQVTREGVRHAGESKEHSLRDCKPSTRIKSDRKCR